MTAGSKGTNRILSNILSIGRKKEKLLSEGQSEYKRTDNVTGEDDYSSGDFVIRAIRGNFKRDVNSGSFPDARSCSFFSFSPLPTPRVRSIHGSFALEKLFTFLHI